MNYFYMSCLVLLLNIYVSYCDDCNLGSLGYDPTILKTNYGQIQGACYQVPLNDPDQPGRIEKVFAWLSVPFAQPPINQLRFKKPQPPLPWSGIKDGRSFSNRCMQTGGPTEANATALSEDCLYLNIFVPANVVLSKQLTPVYIWIHGGAFSIGSGTDSVFDSRALAGLANMIVVTINYRLGPFGFMYVQNTEISGNQGFLDQAMAFRWVYENAYSFYGDANKITIGGESAGSFSTSFHLIHPPSWPYFRSVIMESGSLLYDVMTFMPLDEATRRANAVLTNVGCGNYLSSPSDLLACAQKVDANTLLTASTDYRNASILKGVALASELTPLFRFVQDGTEFKYSIKESFEKNIYKKVNVLSGFNHDEGGLGVAFSGIFGFPPSGSTFLNYTMFKNYLDQFYLYFPTYPTPSTTDFKNAVINEYTKNIVQTNSTNYLNVLIQMMSEESFICPVIDLARIMSKLNNVFLYSFNHIKSNPLFGKDFGVIHTDELSFVFAEPLRQPTAKSFNDDERRLSKQMIRYWANFIKFNDPNLYAANDANRNPNWPVYKSDISIDVTGGGSFPLNLFNFQNYLNIPRTNNYYTNYIIFETNNITASNDFSFRHCGFWRNYNNYPNMSKA